MSSLQRSRAVSAARLLGAAALLTSAAAIADAPVYSALPAQSALTFVGTQQGEKFTGTIRDFDARIRYAADALASSGIEVTIRLKSIDTKSPDRDEALVTADWFDVAKYPTATFRTVAVRAMPPGLVADADLTIKGRTKRILFPFTWKAQGTTATLDARVTLDRLDFGIGAGEWADESMVKRKVEVVVHLTLTPASPATAPAPATPATPAKTSGKHR
jgi:polyisoprenoid-binding protein YceI